MTQVYVQRPLPRWLVAMLGVTTTVIAVAGMKAAATLIAPVFLALVLAVGVQPVLAQARRHGVPRWLAVLLTVLAAQGVVIGLAVALTASVGRLAGLLPAYADRWDDILTDLRAFLAGIGVSADQVRAALASIDPSSVVGFVTGLLSGLVGIAGSLLFILATVSFMTVDSSTLPERLDAVPGVRPGLGAALAGFAASTRSYLWVSTLFGLLVAIIDTVALWAMGIPLPLVWGLLAFITNYVPNIGFVIGVAPPALLALLVDGPRLAVLVIVVYSVVNFVLQSVIQPKFVGDAVGLSITATFLSLVLWSWILGPLGAILAIPLSLLVKAVLLDHDSDNQWALALVSSPPRKQRGSRPPAAGEEAAPPSLPDRTVPPNGAVPRNRATAPESPVPGEERGSRPLDA